MSRGSPEDYLYAGAGAVTGALKYYVKPELTAKRAWTAIGLGVLAYEALCPNGELLSEGADRLVDKHPIASRIAGLAVAGHVMNLLPDTLDPIHQLVKHFKR